MTCKVHPEYAAQKRPWSWCAGCLEVWHLHWERETLAAIEALFREQGRCPTQREVRIRMGVWGADCTVTKYIHRLIDKGLLLQPNGPIWRGLELVKRGPVSVPPRETERVDVGCNIFAA